MRKHRPDAAAHQPSAAKSDEIFGHLIGRRPAAIAVLDAEDRIIAWNSWAEHLTGYTLQEVHSRPLAHLLQPADILHRHLQLARAEVPTGSEPFHLTKACRRQVRVEVQCSLLRHLHQRDPQAIVVMQPMASRRERSGSDREFFQRSGLVDVMHTLLHPPLQALVQQADALNDALRPAMTSPSMPAKQPLITMKAMIDDLRRSLDQLRVHTNLLFGDVYSALNVLYLQADLLEEALKRPAEALPTEVERALAAIQAEASHIQTLIKREA
jgi:PAS domain S-box-containing protein